MADAPKPNSQGANTADLDTGQQRDGAPAAPVVVNTPPVVDPKEGKDETHVDPKAEQAKADAAAKAVADKAAADAASKAADALLPDPAPDAEVVAYPTLDDASAQAAVDLLKEAKVPPAEANAIFAKYLETGNATDIDSKTLTAKLGKAQATLVINGVKQAYTEAKTKTEAVVAQTHGIMGGAEQWNLVRDWAQKAESDPAVKVRVDHIRTMLNQGGIAAELGAKELKAMYEAVPTHKGLATHKLSAGDGKTTTSSKDGLSRANYLKELKSAEGRGAPQDEIKQLHARRRAGMAAGL